jgi:hypothetical protein
MLSFSLTGACYSTGGCAGHCLCNTGYDGIDSGGFRACNDCTQNTAASGLPSYFGSNTHGTGGPSTVNLACTICPGGGTCSGHGTCASGKTGSGSCTCSDGWSLNAAGSCSIQDPCAMGYGVPYPGADRCEICMRGKFAAGTTGACQNCAQGAYAHYTGTSACTQCPKLSKRLGTAEGINAVACVCQAGYFMKCSKGQASACLNDAPQVPGDYFCEKCPRGADCNSGGELKPATGSWQSPPVIGSVKGWMKLAGLPTSLATEPARTSFKAYFSSAMESAVLTATGSVSVTAVTGGSPATLDVDFAVSINPSANYTAAIINSRIVAFAGTRRSFNFFAQLSTSLSNATLVPSSTSITSSGFTTLTLTEPEFAGTSIYICPYAKNCQGVNGSMCAVGAEGPLCGLCSDGYSLKENGCEKCPESAAGSFMKLIILAVILVLILLCVYGAYMAISEAEEASVNEDQATNTIAASSIMSGTNVEMAAFGTSRKGAPGSPNAPAEDDEELAEDEAEDVDVGEQAEEAQGVTDELQGNLEEGADLTGVDPEVPNEVPEGHDMDDLIDGMLDVDAEDAAAFHGSGPEFGKSDKEMNSELMDMAGQLGIDGGSIDKVTGKASEAAGNIPGIGKADKALADVKETAGGVGAGLLAFKDLFEPLQDFLSSAASALGTPLKIVIGDPPCLLPSSALVAFWLQQRETNVCCPLFPRLLSGHQ